MSTSRESERLEIRLDKWLWCARFFKSRSLANQAIKAGHVRLNGHSSKTSRAVKVSDRLDIYLKPYTHSLIVRKISASRGPASQARQLYEELPESISKREELAEQLKLSRPAETRPKGRPGKHERRKIIRFTRRQD